jgi:hypothetical protein
VRPAARKKQWTVLVWIAGDNNLDTCGIADLQEMKKVGSNDDLDIVAQIDRRGDGRTYRYHVAKGTTLDADLVGTLGETDTGDPAVAIDFFTWGLTRYPSEKILAVIWNHGSGIDETDIYSRAASAPRATRRGAPAVSRAQVRAIASSRLRTALFSTTVDAALRAKAIAYDDTNKDFLDNAELKRVLVQVARKAGRPLDVLGFDACLMNMVEVAYQLRGLVGHIVASEEVEPGDGWPYNRVLARLAARPGATGAELAQAIVAEYLRSYTPSDGVTNSALDLSRVGAVARAVNALARACIASLGNDREFAAFTKALRSAQRFEERDFVDLGDLCKQLVARSTRPVVRQASRVVLDVLGGDSPFVVAEGHKGRALRGATGTSIYLPTVGDVQVSYAQLDFARATRWGDLIKKVQRV